MTPIPDGLLLIATCLDLLTCGNLEYKSAHDKADSRAIAAARLVNEDAIYATPVEGYYKVKSDHLRKSDGSPVYYDVVMTGDESACQCQDFYMRGKDGEPPMICKHRIGVAMFAAIHKVLS